jgi:hypothetical protein
MSLADWRAKRQMRDPVRGVFRVCHPQSARIAGVLVAPGIPATPAEYSVDARGRRVTQKELPALIDRSEPARFVILWSEVTEPAQGEPERRAAGAGAGADELDFEEHF